MLGIVFQTISKLLKLFISWSFRMWEKNELTSKISPSTLFQMKKILIGRNYLRWLRSNVTLPKTRNLKRPEITLPEWILFFDEIIIWEEKQEKVTDIISFLIYEIFFFLFILHLEYSFRVFLSFCFFSLLSLSIAYFYSLLQRAESWNIAEAK